MKSFVRLLAMALALAATSHASEPERDQYSLAGATGHPPPKRPPDLQVGCADGAIHDGLASKSARRRRKRAYEPWPGQLAHPRPFQSISVWRPPVYALQRPYYVPIYGVQGKPPIYFPPQPLYANPGSPEDNPPRFQGPPYLPPRESSTKMPLDDRFGGDRPVWVLDEQTTEVVPTRAPRPPGADTPPPLVHGPPGGGEADRPPPRDSPTRRPPTTRRPSPTRPPTTRRPYEPTRCVWAIISCCSATGEISYDCFEERGCPGAFWDSSPCDSEYAKAAIAAALNYYN